MISEIRNATEADLESVKKDMLHEWKKSYPIDHIEGWAKSLYIYDELVAVGGVLKYWNGVGEAWLVLGKKSGEHKIEVVRKVRQMLWLAMDELKLWRIQATERRDFHKSVKMAEHLGFKLEGLMLKYTADKADAYLYALVKE